jgi:GNAT superfamily N-acetyltransferase
MSDITYKRHSGEQMLAMLYEVANFYGEIHTDMPEEQGGIFSRQSFLTRTASQAQAPGFELITATLRESLVGLTFGYPMAAGRWWGDCTSAPEEILAASKFAVIELDVRKSYRRQGIAKTLLDMLLSDRDEDFATLASTPGAIANAMYKRWGWYKVGVFTDSMEALVFPIGKK